MPSEYVSVHVKRATHTALQAAQLRLSAEVGRRLTMTDVVRAGLELLERHHAEAVAALSE